jgi:hypothetical protein
MTKDELRRLDRSVYLAELAQPKTMWTVIGLTGLTVLLLFTFAIAAFLPLIGIAFELKGVRDRGFAKRFSHRRLRKKWNQCEERLRRFHAAMARAKGTEAAHLKDLPSMVENLGASLYGALRGADRALVDIAESEGFRLSRPDTELPQTKDPQTAKLYQDVKKSEQEYRTRVNRLIAGVERAEAQAAFFVATLDTLRVRVLEARLAGKTSARDSEDALEGLKEVKLQLDSIDRAREEIYTSPLDTLDAHWEGAGDPESGEEVESMEEVKSRLDQLSSHLSSDEPGPDESEEEARS